MSVNTSLYNDYLQGVLFALPDCAKTPVDLVRLWRHEAERVYKDKLVDSADLETYEKLSKDVIKKSFEVRNSHSCPPDRYFHCLYPYPYQPVRKIKIEQLHVGCTLAGRTVTPL